MSLVNTLMVNMRIQSPELDRWEYRASRYGCYDLYKRETTRGAILSQDLIMQAKRSIGRTIQVPVIDYDAGISIGNTRSVTIADSENTSQLVTFTFTTYAWGFTMVPTLFMNNDIGFQKDFNTKARKYVLKFAETLDSAGITALEAAKSQVLSDNLGGKYAFTSNVVAATLAQQDEVVGDVTVLMSGNDYYDQLHVVGSNALQSLIRNRLLERGQFNEVDKTYQYNDKQFYFTNRLSDAANKKATGIAVNQGSLGFLTRFEREAVAGTRLPDGTEWGTTVLPLVDMEVGTYSYFSKGDYSAIAGAASADMDRVHKQHFGFAVDVAFVTAYNSSAGTLASPILKFDVADS